MHRTIEDHMPSVERVPLGPIPGSYVYVAALQGAAKEIALALEAMSDGRAFDPVVAGQSVEVARQHIEGIYLLKEHGVTS